MKKTPVFLALLLVVFSCLVGCKPNQESASQTASDEAPKLRIVATIFPAYDWLREILGNQSDKVELTLLLDNGVDLHNFQPNAQDVRKIAACDLFVCVGGESDEWTEDVLKQQTNPRRRVVKLLETLGDAAREEVHVEGMEEEHHDHDAEEEHEEHEKHELDEHVWLSLRNAQLLCRSLCQELSSLDPTNAARYEANTSAYIAELADLDSRYCQAVEQGTRRVMLFGDRFPFRYLAEDYGLEYYDAFAGCSAESEASFKTITFLARKVDELGLPCVLTLEGNHTRIAETIIANTKTKTQRVLAMDSLQSTTLSAAQAGATYLQGMGRNLEVLREALK